MKFYLYKPKTEIFLFLFAFCLYAYTAERTVSFWDCGEFIACAYRLQNPHPPGAPLFLLLGRIASFFAFGQHQWVAYCLNLSSAVYSSLTVLFLFWTLKKILSQTSPHTNTISTLAALTFAFTDSFWFNATETEVYALSTLLTAISFWAMLKWHHDNSVYADKWLLFVAYLIGLAIGVHLLNLLVIPALSILFYVKKYQAKIYGIFLSFTIGCIILGIVQFGIIQYLPTLALKLDIFLVNRYRLPFFSGLWMLLAVIALVSSVGLIVAHFKRWKYLQIGILSFLLILIGYSVYALMVLRSLKNPNIDEGNPENLTTLIQYLRRDQYGHEPLFWADSYDSHGNKEKDIKISYVKADSVYYPDRKKHKYIPVDINYVPKYSNPVFFPRRYSDDRLDWFTYADFSNRWTFFAGYQVGWMYFRYLLFNFLGRSSDIQGAYWESGLWDTKTVVEFPTNKGKNHYFGIPLLLGIIGLWVTFKKSHFRPYRYVILTLFFMTGIAIVIYLNQTPSQARERDYSYVGSFYAFTIWIAIGMQYLLNRVSNQKTILKYIAWAVIVFCPLILLQQNFDDHNRKGRYFALDIAKNILNSCEKNAILFTDGDNDTFTLWYAQEVEKIRTDVRVVNITLLGIDHYIWHLKHIKNNDADSLNIPVPDERYTAEKMSYNYLKNEPVLLISADKDTIQWELPIKEAKRGELGYLYKSEYFAYQIIKHNFDKRPIYFSATIAFERDKHFFNLEPYLQLQGMAYKLTTQKNTTAHIATADKNKLKHFIDAQFVCSGFDNKKVWVEELAIEHADYYRKMYLELIKKLIEDKDTTAARRYFVQMQRKINPECIPFAPVLQAKFLSLIQDKNVEKLFVETCIRYLTHKDTGPHLTYQAKDAIKLIFENKVKQNEWGACKEYAELYQKLTQEDTLLKLYEKVSSRK
ncbi:MAG: DUF2723 domain-containing protein [Bacteroidia bacterium]|nr:DUF2723 domain-containing protein [Bacteroidia bacterium]MDW8348077.1 DUF2723 domain-containing protein [Bacteroidia bacterium]